MKVACVQMDVLHCRKPENLEKALYLALEAVAKGAEIIVFPEVFSTGFCYEDFDHAAENLPSPTLENLACFSEANDCVLIGSVIQKDIAVSYTHLRAHETRHDLVCRLLLEKK